MLLTTKPKKKKKKKLVSKFSWHATLESVPSFLEQINTTKIHSAKYTKKKRFILSLNFELKAKLKNL